MSEYYTYVWCDPRTGRKTYGGWSFPGEPFYYGRGRGDRWLTNKRNSAVNERLEELKQLGLEPLRYFIDDNTKEDSLISEKYFIALIGRKDKGLGPLLNRSNGGEHAEGRIGRKGSWDHINKSPNYKNSMQGRKHKESSKKLQSERALNNFANGRVNPMTGTAPKSKGQHWYNNGIVELMADMCPDKYIPGRLPKLKERISETVKRLHQEGVYT